MNDMSANGANLDEVGSEEEQEEVLSEVDNEAKHRWAQIRTSIRSRFFGEEYCKFIDYEVQELCAGRTIPEDQMVINMEELKIILYSHDLEKKEIRRIIANISNRARKILEKSEAKAREKNKAMLPRKK